MLNPWNRADCLILFTIIYASISELICYQHVVVSNEILCFLVLHKLGYLEMQVLSLRNRDLPPQSVAVWSHGGVLLWLFSLFPTCWVRLTVFLLVPYIEYTLSGLCPIMTFGWCSGYPVVSWECHIANTSILSPLYLAYLHWIEIILEWSFVCTCRKLLLIPVFLQWPVGCSAD